jgi:phosphoribosylglycinamide formyltransferase 2
MLDGDALDHIVDKHRPDLIVPEIEAIRTERFYEYEKKGYTVIPSAKAANFTMNRKAIRDLAAKDLGLKTAAYDYATTFESFRESVKRVGIPCVVKPLMSSSGKGQSVVRTTEDIETAWDYAISGSRGDYREEIVEAFVAFESEITLLTVTQRNGPTLFCPPIGHWQERGDYRESWQPCAISDSQLTRAQEMADKVTRALGGPGIWGVEFFLTKEDVYFSELSPRPHDTGMVTLAGTQNLSEFELHARAITGLPIPSVLHLRNGASAVILADGEGGLPDYDGVARALSLEGTDIRIFAKPSTRPYRRMAVALASGNKTESIEALRRRAAEAAAMIHVLRPAEVILPTSR